MERGSRGASGAADWLPRAGRLIVANERLLVYELAVRVLEALAFGIVTLASRSTFTFDAYARDAVDSPARTLDLLAGSPSSGTIAALAGAFVAVTLASAWLRGALIRSLVDGGMVRWPGRGVFVRLVILYAATGIAFVGVQALMRDDGTAGLVLPLVVALSVPTLYADYAVVLAGRGVLGAFWASFATVRKRPRASVLLLAATIVLAVLESSLMIDPLKDATGVFPPFFAAILLTDAVAQYLEDCTLVAIFQVAGAGASADADAGPGAGLPDRPAD